MPLRTSLSLYAIMILCTAAIAVSAQFEQMFENMFARGQHQQQQQRQQQQQGGSAGPRGWDLQNQGAYKPRALIATHRFADKSF